MRQGDSWPWQSSSNGLHLLKVGKMKEKDDYLRKKRKRKKHKII
jgi:hypothetical protein